MTLASAATETPSNPAEHIAAIERAAARRTTANGPGHVVWRIWGDGYPLVLLHGGTGSWMHWVRNVEPLAREFKVIVPDIPGSGESDNPEPPISAEGIAAVLRDGLATLIGADTGFAMAGFSMGGLVSGYLARHAGARAQCLVLVGATGMNTKRPEMEPLKSWRRLPTAEEKRKIQHLGILMIYDPAKIDALAVHIQAANAELSRIRGKHVSHTGVLTDCLQGFAGRLAGIWGEHDATAAPYFEERRARIAEFSPSATFEIFPGAGHWVQYEADERFNRRLAELARPLR